MSRAKGLARNLLLVLSGLLPVSAMACSSGVFCSGPIELLYLDETSAYIKLAGGLSGLTGCTPASGVYLTLPKTHANYTSLYAALLAAYFTKESVTLRMVEGSSNCALLYMTIP
jgi:hypothetical protein